MAYDSDAKACTTYEQGLYCREKSVWGENESSLFNDTFHVAKYAISDPHIRLRCDPLFFLIFLSFLRQLKQSKIN